MTATVPHTHACCLTENGAALIPRAQLLPKTVVGWKMGPFGPQSWVANADAELAATDEALSASLQSLK